MSRSDSRTLYLDHQLRLGEWLDDAGFQCNWEWWLQMTMLLPKLCADDSRVSDKDANELADLLERDQHSFGWQVHLNAWGDDDAIALREFIDFLRRGEFGIVALADEEPK